MGGTESEPSLQPPLISRLRLPSRMLRIVLLPLSGQTLVTTKLRYAVQCSSYTNCRVLFGTLKAPYSCVPRSLPQPRPSIGTHGGVNRAVICHESQLGPFSRWAGNPLGYLTLH